ncbi:MAG TPA: hypothetical protein VFE34_07300 [Dongiaceae bacterium]|jgi:hypothetical protein|nr:hypothetical protein [Dongiaceae bacterium]
MIMLAPILIGFAAWIAVSIGSALLLFAHLTGRIRRATALSMAGGAVLVGGAIAGSSAMDLVPFGPMAIPFGVFLVLAAGINGLLACGATGPAPRSRTIRPARR